MADDAAGAGGARPQGRTRAGVRPAARAGLRARARRRRRARPRRRCRRSCAKNSTIEAVVDRFVGDHAPALAESSNRARLATAAAPLVAIAPGRTTAAARPLFSAKFACPVCDYALPGWSRGCSRSTRRSAPARPATAWAQSQFFDPARVVVHPELSLAAGAVRGWDKRNQFYFQTGSSPPRSTTVRYGHAVRSWRKTSAEAVLFGSGREKSPSRYLTEGGRHAPQPQASLRGHRAEPGTPLSRNRIARRCARRSKYQANSQALPRLRRRLRRNRQRFVNVRASPGEPDVVLPIELPALAPSEQ